MLTVCVDVAWIEPRAGGYGLGRTRLRTGTLPSLRSLTCRWWVRTRVSRDTLDLGRCPVSSGASLMNFLARSGTSSYVLRSPVDKAMSIYSIDKLSAKSPDKG